MPRWINWSQNPVNEWYMNNPAYRLEEPVYGKGEVKSLAVPGLKAYSRQHQFSNHGATERHKNNQTFFEGVFKWLEDNCEGPWHFDEGWENHGHSADLGIYIEQKPDQEKFQQSSWAPYVKYLPPTERHTLNTAITLGFVEPYNSDEISSLWASEARKRLFDIDTQRHDNKDPDGKDIPTDITIRFKDDLTETRFVTDWVENAKSFAPTGNPNEYRSNTADDFDVRHWLKRNTVANKLLLDLTSRTFYSMVKINHPELLKDFEKRWGARARKLDDGSYRTPENTPERKIPQAFHDYIEGRIPLMDALKKNKLTQTTPSTTSSGEHPMPIKELWNERIITVKDSGAVTDRNREIGAMAADAAVRVREKRRKEKAAPKRTKKLKPV